MEPCTPKGIITLIKSMGEQLDGEEAVVIDCGNIVGKPIALMLLSCNETVQLRTAGQMT